jgi:hypothetical protein
MKDHARDLLYVASSAVFFSIILHVVVFIGSSSEVSPVVKFMDAIT